MSAICQEGVALLKRSEDFIGIAYPDPASPMGRALQDNGMWLAVLHGAEIPARFMHLSAAPWTIGYGFTEGVKQGDKMTRVDADARLDAEIAEYAEHVRAMCHVEPNENQLAALVVCGWNIGIPALETSSMIRAHNRRDFAAAARAFNLWNKAGGKVSHALVVRRAAESALYLKREEGDDYVPSFGRMPQSVMGESSLLKSPIVQTATATGTGAIATISTIADQINTLHYSFGQLSFIKPYVPGLLIAGVVVASGLVIYHRWKQRHEGWV